MIESCPLFSDVWKLKVLSYIWFRFYTGCSSRGHLVSLQAQAWWCQRVKASTNVTLKISPSPLSLLLARPGVFCLASILLSIASPHTPTGGGTKQVIQYREGGITHFAHSHLFVRFRLIAFLRSQKNRPTSSVVVIHSRKLKKITGVEEIGSLPSLSHLSTSKLC